MMGIGRWGKAVLLVLALAGGGVAAQDTEVGVDEGSGTWSSNQKPGWFDSADLSLVYTEGNSVTQTFGFANKLDRYWKKARFRVKLAGTRSATAPDAYVLLNPGTIIVDPDNPQFDSSDWTVQQPSAPPATEKYFFEPRYDRHIRKKIGWNAGFSWDRNLDAGILSRWIYFGGMTNIWWNREDFKFNTAIGLSYTNRTEQTIDPEQDDQFLGVRFNWAYTNQWGKNTTFENDMTLNMSLKQLNDWSGSMTTSVAVSMSKRLQLKFALNWLYNNLPALESVDVIAQVSIVDPDPTMPGDEIIVSDPDGAFMIDLGMVNIRKDQLDTTVSTSLVLNF